MFKNQDDEGLVLDVPKGVLDVPDGNHDVPDEVLDIYDGVLNVSDGVLNIREVALPKAMTLRLVALSNVLFSLIFLHFHYGF